MESMDTYVCGYLYQVPTDRHDQVKIIQALNPRDKKYEICYNSKVIRKMIRGTQNIFVVISYSS